MSCYKCDEFQDSNMTSYIRWKNANVEIRACEEHLKEVMDVVRKASAINSLKEKDDK